MLGSVEVSGSLTLVLGFLLCGDLVAVVQVRDNVGVELLDSLFKWRERLDSTDIQWLEERFILNR